MTTVKRNRIWQTDTKSGEANIEKAYAHTLLSHKMDFNIEKTICKIALRFRCTYSILMINKIGRMWRNDKTRNLYVKDPADHESEYSDSIMPKP